ncbi:MAG: hypothetical protein ACRES2_04110, partial [Steroidobacteraceae bacterium]
AQGGEEEGREEKSREEEASEEKAGASSGSEKAQREASDCKEKGRPIAQVGAPTCTQGRPQETGTQEIALPHA